MLKEREVTSMKNYVVEIINTLSENRIFMVKDAKDEREALNRALAQYNFYCKDCEPMKIRIRKSF